MTYIHNYPVTVRHHECDMHGWVRPAVVLNYMQEAAFSASAAVGYSARRYDEIGLQWFAYETDLSLLSPLSYGDSLTVRTWVHDFRRVRSLRCYELYRSSDGALVAQGTTDWVLVDVARQYPTTIPPEIIAAYAQGDPVTDAPPRPPFEKLPPAPPDAYRLRRAVEPHEIDPARHVNNAVYVQYAALAQYRHLTALGWGIDQRAASGGWVASHRYQIAYKLAATLDDEIDIATWNADLTPQGGVRYTLMTRARDERTLAQVRTEWAWRAAPSGEAATLPAGLRAALGG